MPRKHLIAASTNKKQQANAKLWQKLAKEIRAAAKFGGPNLDGNPRLKFAVEKALANNLSRESIDKNIYGSKNEALLEEMEFEGFGPDGVAIIVHALSDNSKRVAGNIRGYFNKLNGNLAKPGSASILFEKKGIILLLKNQIEENNLLEILLENSIDDLITIDDYYQILCSPENLNKIVKVLKEHNIEIDSADINLYAANKVEVKNAEDFDRLQHFIKQCEDDDDISWVVTNMA